MEPITLVNPLNGYRVVVTVPTEEHNLRAQGYHEPKPEPAPEPVKDVVVVKAEAVEAEDEPIAPVVVPVKKPR